MIINEVKAIEIGLNLHAHQLAITRFDVLDNYMFI